MSTNNENKSLHIVMYPWFALSHLTSFLRLANKLAERGHKTSFFVPTKTQPKLAPQNHHPNLITFVPVDIRHVDGLPQGAETTNDVMLNSSPVILKARDMSSKELVDTYLASHKPDYVLYDFAHWLPALARKHGAKCIYYSIPTLVPFAYTCFTARNLTPDSRFTDTELMDPPPGFPSAAIRLHAGEARSLARTCMQEVEKGMTAQKMIHLSQLESDAIGSKTCREMEGPYCDFLGKHMGKPVLLAGPTVLDPPTGELDERFDGWLKDFSKGSVVYCALGSECVLQKELFQELVLGLELTGKPFLAVLKLPEECETMESALPEGFSERTKDRGIVHSGWVQQLMILQHPSVGCFVTHCGSGSLSEALPSECQLVLLPQNVDQFINARMMSMELRVGIEIEKREDDSVFTRFDVCKAITTVMDVESGVGKEVRDNHSKWRELLLDKKLEESYITEFIQNLQRLLE